jgi:hypothetical protein
VIGALWLAAALAADTPCEPLDELDFRELLLQLQAGIDRGNLDLSTDVITTFHARTPCLTFAPEPRRWADLLVGEAIVKFAAGEDWEPVMAAALHIYPAVDRGVSSRHPLATWEPPEPRPPGPQIAQDTRLFVDGLPSERLPALGEVHLVQRTDGRFWNTVRTGPDDPLPPGWAEDKVVQPARIISYGAIGLGVGVASLSQVPSFSTDWVQRIEPGQRAAPALAAHVQAQATFYSPFGVYGRASVWTWSASPGIDAQVAGIWTYRGLMLGAGAGTASVDAFQGPAVDSELATLAPDSTESHRLYLPRYALGTAQLRSGRSTRWHAGLTIGSGPQTQRGLLEAHVSPEASGGSRWRVGASVEWIATVLEEQRFPRNTLNVGSVRGGLHLSRVWGEY